MTYSFHQSQICEKLLRRFSGYTFTCNSREITLDGVVFSRTITPVKLSLSRYQIYHFKKPLWTTVSSSKFVILTPSHMQMHAIKCMHKNGIFIAKFHVIGMYLIEAISRIYLTLMFTLYLEMICYHESCLKQPMCDTVTMRGVLVIVMMFMYRILSLLYKNLMYSYRIYEWWLWFEPRHWCIPWSDR